MKNFNKDKLVALIGLVALVGCGVLAYFNAPSEKRVKQNKNSVEQFRINK